MVTSLHINFFAEDNICECSYSFIPEFFNLNNFLWIRKLRQGKDDAQYLIIIFLCENHLKSHINETKKHDILPQAFVC